jgi:hypothetical protein
MSERDITEVRTQSSPRHTASWLEDVPVWSGIGSVVLLTAVLAFDEPHMGQYALLFIAQLFYLASVLMRD